MSSTGGRKLKWTFTTMIFNHCPNGTSICCRDLRYTSHNTRKYMSISIRKSFDSTNIFRKISLTKINLIILLKIRFYFYSLNSIYCPSLSIYDNISLISYEWRVYSCILSRVNRTIAPCYHNTIVPCLITENIRQHGSFVKKWM